MYEKKIDEFKQQILMAMAQAEPLLIVGGNSRQFFGREISGQPLSVSTYQGIISYEPTELFITVRAGTLVSQLKEVLAEKRQMLAFEPAGLNKYTTAGGMVACGLSGPRRPYMGSVRDHVLGIRCINGLAKDLSFGGQLVKNVAGYDISRLMTGALGTLGVILDISLKVVPLPEYESSCCKQIDLSGALQTMRSLKSRSLPVSASLYDGHTLFIRLSGNEQTVSQSVRTLAFDEYPEGETLWNDLRDYKLPFFNTDQAIWRLSVPEFADLDLAGESCLIDWGGAQYWLQTDRTAKELFALAAKAGGSALLFSGGNHKQEVFQPLSPALLVIQESLKQAFDPHRILNPGKMYTGI